MHFLRQIDDTSYFSASLPQEDDLKKTFKGDKWTRILGSLIPVGAEVDLIKYCYRRRVLVEYQGQTVLTMLWCLDK